MGALDIAFDSGCSVLLRLVLLLQKQVNADMLHSIVQICQLASAAGRLINDCAPSSSEVQDAWDEFLFGTGMAVPDLRS